MLTTHRTQERKRKQKEKDYKKKTKQKRLNALQTLLKLV